VFRCDLGESFLLSRLLGVVPVRTPLRDALQGLLQDLLYLCRRSVTLPDGGVPLAAQRLLLGGCGGV
jgi:hypothetical protein